MITTREFFEHDAEDIINNIESIYSKNSLVVIMLTLSFTFLLWNNYIITVSL